MSVHRGAGKFHLRPSAADIAFSLRMPDKPIAATFEPTFLSSDPPGALPASAEQ